MADGAELIVARIAAQSATIGGGPWAAGTNVFASALLAPSEHDGAIPQKAMFVVPAGGPAPWMTFGAADRNIRRQEYTVYVRGSAPDTREATRDAAYNAWTAVHRATISGFINCVCVSDVLMLTTQPTDLPLFSFRVQTWEQTY